MSQIGKKCGSDTTSFGVAPQGLLHTLEHWALLSTASKQSLVVTVGCPASLGQKGIVGTLIGHRCSGEQNEVEMEETPVPGKNGMSAEAGKQLLLQTTNPGVSRAVHDALAPLSGQSNEACAPGGG